MMAACSPGCGRRKKSAPEWAVSRGCRGGLTDSAAWRSATTKEADDERGQKRDFSASHGHMSEDGEGKRKRFGTRYLDGDHDVYEHNAWDNVQWTPELEDAARSKTAVHATTPVNPERQSKSAHVWGWWCNCRLQRSLRLRRAHSGTPSTRTTRTSECVRPVREPFFVSVLILLIVQCW